MSEAHGPEQQPDPTDEEPSGPNLKVAYGLIAIALFAAICIALLIVLPFYHRR
ncbi:MAG TPA: hypothetical protein VK574_04980 [Terracidiphilus sp.]|nr:hypothetical protein [Terracidiphilus sp.]